MKTTKYLVYEFLEERKPGSLLGVFQDIADVEYKANALYPIKYRNEPSYPYIMVMIEDERNTPIPYCYFAK